MSAHDERLVAAPRGNTQMAGIGVRFGYQPESLFSLMPDVELPCRGADRQPRVVSVEAEACYLRVQGWRRRDTRAGLRLENHHFAGFIANGQLRPVVRQSNRSESSGYRGELSLRLPGQQIPGDCAAIFAGADEMPVVTGKHERRDIARVGFDVASDFRS
ncbi:MAG: hypothetical protein P8X53_13800 [Chromatiales bacterium]